MKKLILALGTNSKQKIEYVTELVKEIGLDIELSPVDVKSGIASQPLTEEDTLKGSINRAKDALNKVSRADCGLGIEVGYNKNKKGNYEILCYASIIDKDSNIFSGASHKFLIPKFFQDKLKNNEQVGHYVKDYLQTDSHPVSRFIAEMVRGRKPFIVESVRDALLFYLKKEEFDL